MRSFDRKAKRANTAFAEAEDTYNQTVLRRAEAYEALKKKAYEQNNSVIEFARQYTAGEPNAVSTYFELVLSQSKYPKYFPLNRKVAYVPESRQLVLELDLPSLADTVPSADRFRYVQKSDEIVEQKRPEKLRHAIYTNVIAQSVLRSLYDIFHGDKQGVVETAVINAHVSTIDPATSHNIHPCLVSVRASSSHFLDLDLRHVEPVSCLKTVTGSYLASAWRPNPSKTDTRIQYDRSSFHSGGGYPLRSRQKTEPYGAFTLRVRILNH
jgi:restriction system protein